MDERTLARFMSKVEVQPNGCWAWVGTMQKHGYGQFALSRSSTLAHRAAFLHFKGEIPAGLQIDHVCHTEDLTCPGGTTDPHRRCVNPAHLEAVTGRQNALRGRSPSARNAVKRHCLNGHEYTSANTYVDTTGGRECRTCRDARAKAWMAVHNPGVRHGTETDCPQGHPYAGSNLYIIPSSGGRVCRICKRNQGRESARRCRAAKKATSNTT